MRLEQRVILIFTLQGRVEMKKMSSMGKSDSMAVLTAISVNIEN